MLEYCLFLLHWFVPPHNAVSIFLFVVAVLAILVCLEVFVFGRNRDAKSAIPRVQSVCEDMRRRMASGGADQAAALQSDELCERGVLSQQP